MERIIRILRNIFAPIAGFLIGSCVNMGLIMISEYIIPSPEGFDNSTMERMNETAHLLEPRHFIMPFLAHALGTLVGALVAGLVAPARKMIFALVIGAFFLLGGITMCFLVSFPAWVMAVDLVGAYFPMAWIGGKLATRKSAA